MRTTMVTIFTGLMLFISVPGRAHAQTPIEPRAGEWKTWVLKSGSELRLPRPPTKAATDAEMKELRSLASRRDAAALDRVNFWDAGSPGYRWIETARAQTVKNKMNALRGTRVMALVSVAVYDATIAAWDSKYSYKRRRPGEADSSFTAAIANPRSPSYPEERAVSAGAAAAVLAYLFPAEAVAFEQQAQEAGRSRLLAGVAYPSDVRAGLELGRAVAARVIERAKTDGSDAKWTGAIPGGPGRWVGTNPVEPMAGTWRTWVLASPSQFRPAPPAAYDSPEKAAEIAEIKNFQRTFANNYSAFYWQSGPSFALWGEVIDKKIFEYRLDANPPRAARAYALMHVTVADSWTACMDGKYAYWYGRPSHLDPTIVTLFPNPNHPSYPGAHGCNSSAQSTILAYLFPRDAEALKARGQEAADSRLWAGIHYRSDNEAGLALGRAVAALVIERAKADGAK